MISKNVIFHGAFPGHSAVVLGEGKVSLQLLFQLSRALLSLTVLCSQDIIKYSPHVNMKF